MQSNEYSAYDSYDYVGGAATEPLLVDEDPGVLLTAGAAGSMRGMDINFDDPKIASLPKLLLMGPRRGGKSSVQVRMIWTVSDAALSCKCWFY